MPQRELVPQHYLHLPGAEEGLQRVCLQSRDAGSPFDFVFDAVGPNVFRTTFSSELHPLPPRPSTLPALSAEPLKAEFAERVPSLPQAASASAEVSTRTRWLQAGDATAQVDWTRSPVVSITLAGSNSPIHEDLPFRSYVVDGSGIAHYTRYARGTLHVGIGEKAAPMNLSNRRFNLSATDCFGYDVYRTDPMYKHIPLIINATPKGCVAIFSTSHARGTWDVGCEMDGLWGPFKCYRQDHGGLEEYVIVGRTLKEVVRSYADLVGYPRLVPRWAFGYLAGGMKYSMLDDPPASEALMEFADKLREHDIPCSGFQMSSGYTVAEKAPKTRNVFTWNYHRFPDPKEFIDKYHARGIRLIANVKPYLLANHPEHAKHAAAGALFTDPKTGQTAETRLWSAGGGESGEGSHIDMTSAAGFEFWYQGVKALKEVGIDCIWNDNNEYTIPSDDWQCALDAECVHDSARAGQERKDVGLWGRSLQTELMGKASYEALVDCEPSTRPFVLTRSATPGTMRYACSSWSGDNVTSWEGMKGANALSLNAGVSLLQNYGHDIGGFEGPQPSPELLLRWIQLGIHSPRFAINCFKTSSANNSVGDVIEPWMYPEITPLVRKAIKRRYQLLPYIYSLMLESHLSATPPQRWTGWGYEDDSEVWTNRVLTDGETQYWLGDALLVGGVYESGGTSARIYLPKSKCEGEDGGYVNMNPPYQYLPPGQWVDIESPWRESIPLLAKVGGAIPIGLDVQTLSAGEAARNDIAAAKLPLDAWRGIEIFPPPWRGEPERAYITKWYEDDGMSAELNVAVFKASYSCTETAIRVGCCKEVTEGRRYQPAWNDVDIFLPVGEGRPVVEMSGKTIVNLGADERGRRIFRVGCS